MAPFWFFVWPTLAAIWVGWFIRREGHTWISTLVMAILFWVTVALLEMVTL
jgi:hypothetical protein